MFASYLPNALQVLGRQFLGKIAARSAACRPSSTNTPLLRNQIDPFFQVANAKCEAGRFGPHGKSGWPSQDNYRSVQQRKPQCLVLSQRLQPAIATCIRRSLSSPRPSPRAPRGRPSPQRTPKRPSKFRLFRFRLESPFNFHVHAFPGPRSGPVTRMLGTADSAPPGIFSLFVRRRQSFPWPHRPGCCRRSPSSLKYRSCRSRTPVRRNLWILQDLIDGPPKPAPRRGIGANLDRVGRGIC